MSEHICPYLSVCWEDHKCKKTFPESKTTQFLPVCFRRFTVTGLSKIIEEAIKKLLSFYGSLYNNKNTTLNQASWLADWLAVQLSGRQHPYFIWNNVRVASVFWKWILVWLPGRYAWWWWYQQMNRCSTYLPTYLYSVCLSCSASSCFIFIKFPFNKNVACHNDVDVKGNHYTWMHLSLCVCVCVG